MVGSTRRLMVGSSNAAPTLRGEMGGALIGVKMLFGE
jgi:hypothetical protein